MKALIWVYSSFYAALSNALSCQFVRDLFVKDFLDGEWDDDFA
jgi:hypothetical protein